MHITEKQIQEEKKKYLFENFSVKNNESRIAELAYESAVRMVLEKTGMQANCDRDCPDADYGNCMHRNDCCKFYF